MFIVWSIQQNQKILEVSCGGGHRAWDYCSQGNTATFVYVKVREVKVNRIVNKSNQTILKVNIEKRTYQIRKAIKIL